MMGIGMVFGLIGFLFIVLLCGVIITGGVQFVKTLKPASNQIDHQNVEHNVTAAEILKQRYARGEITREQSELMKQDLA